MYLRLLLVRIEGYINNYLYSTFESSALFLTLSFYFINVIDTILRSDEENSNKRFFFHFAKFYCVYDVEGRLVCTGFLGFVLPSC